MARPFYFWIRVLILCEATAFLLLSPWLGPMVRDVASTGESAKPLEVASTFNATGDGAIEVLQPLRFTTHLAAAADLHDVTVELDVSEGLRIQGGRPRWHGDLREGENVTVEMNFTAAQAGVHQVWQHLRIGDALLVEHSRAYELDVVEQSPSTVAKGQA